jgi:hypothetical protein
MLAFLGEAAGLLVKSTAVPTRHRFSLQIVVEPARNERALKNSRNGDKLTIT